MSSSRLELLEYSEQPYFLDCKALLVTSLIHVSGAVTSVQTFIFTFIDNHQLDDVLILVTASTLIVSLVSVCLLDVCICYVSNNALSDFREIGFFSWYYGLVVRNFFQAICSFFLSYTRWHVPPIT